LKKALSSFGFGSLVATWRFGEIQFLRKIAKIAEIFLRIERLCPKMWRNKIFFVGNSILRYPVPTCACCGHRMWQKYGEIDKIPRAPLRFSFLQFQSEFLLGRLLFEIIYELS